MLSDQDDHQILVPAGRLPRETKEGKVLRVPVNDAGTPDWGSANIDAAATERRSRDTPAPESPAPPRDTADA